MLVVDFFEFNRNGEDARVGYAGWDGKKLVIKPANLQSMLAEPMRDFDTGELVDSAADPERWLNLLAVNYQGTYFRASAAKEKSPEPIAEPAKISSEDAFAAAMVALVHCETEADADAIAKLAENPAALAAKLNGETSFGGPKSKLPK